MISQRLIVEKKIQSGINGEKNFLTFFQKGLLEKLSYLLDEDGVPESVSMIEEEETKAKKDANYQG